MAKRQEADSRERPASTPVRLQKLLALSGLGSRRECEELITAGRVEVDRQTVVELGVRVDPDRQEVRVDGDPLRLPRKKTFLLHKPPGVISTSRDPWARTRVIDLVEDANRLFTVGRLDKASSGLILVTNDGDLAQMLTHPKFGVEKTYRATVVGKPSPESIQQLRQGLYLAEGKTNVERVVVLRGDKTKSLLEIVLKEGRNREIRRILARVGHKVVQLKRIAIGPLRLGEMPLGAYRELTSSEVQALRKSATPAPDAAEPTKKTGVPVVRVARRALDRGTARSPRGRREGGERGDGRERGNGGGTGGSGKGTVRSDSRGGVRQRDGQRPPGRSYGKSRPDTRSGSGEARPGRGRGAGSELPVRRPRVATVIAGDFQESQAPPMETGGDEGRSRSPRRVMVKPSGRESSRGRAGQRTGREQGGRGRSEQGGRGRSEQGARGSRTQGERRPQGERTPGGRGQGAGGQGSRRPSGGGQGSGGRRPVIRRQRTRRSSE